MFVALPHLKRLLKGRKVASEKPSFWKCVEGKVLEIANTGDGVNYLCSAVHDVLEYIAKPDVLKAVNESSIHSANERPKFFVNERHFRLAHMAIPIRYRLDKDIFVGSKTPRELALWRAEGLVMAFFWNKVRHGSSSASAEKESEGLARTLCSDLGIKDDIDIIATTKAMGFWAEMLVTGERIDEREHKMRSQ